MTSNIVDIDGKPIEAPPEIKEIRFETDAEYYKRIVDVLLQSLKFIYMEPERLGVLTHAAIVARHKVTAWKVAKDTLEFWVDEQTVRKEMQEAFEKAHAEQNPTEQKEPADA